MKLEDLINEDGSYKISDDMVFDRSADYKKLREAARSFGAENLIAYVEKVIPAHDEALKEIAADGKDLSYQAKTAASVFAALLAELAVKNANGNPILLIQNASEIYEHMAGAMIERIRSSLK